MNKNAIVEFKTNSKKGLFVSVPCIYKTFKIEQYSQAGTYVMETDSNGLNHWKINIPRGEYEVIGLSNQLEPELVESKIEIPFKDYIKILNEKDITVSYLDISNFWLVVLLIER